MKVVDVSLQLYDDALAPGKMDLGKILTTHLGGTQLTPDNDPHTPWKLCGQLKEKLWQAVLGEDDELLAVEHGLIAETVADISARGMVIGNAGEFEQGLFEFVGAGALQDVSREKFLAEVIDFVRKQNDGPVEGRLARKTGGGALEKATRGKTKIYWSMLEASFSALVQRR